MADGVHDPVERFLQSPPRAEDGLSWRDTLLARTNGVLRRRRIVRRVTAGAALAACFLAGGLVAWLVKPESSPAQPADIAANPIPAPKAPEESKTPKAVQSRVPAVAQEWSAFDASAQRARKFREAGDRYLQESQDIEAALRCYRQALDAGGDEELIVTPSDSWLLIALKDARQKEKNHALGGS
jgi:hypothetical protein